MVRDWSCLWRSFCATHSFVARWRAFFIPTRGDRHGQSFVVRVRRCPNAPGPPGLTKKKADRLVTPTLESENYSIQYYRRCAHLDNLRFRAWRSQVLFVSLSSFILPPPPHPPQSRVINSLTVERNGTARHRNNHGSTGR